jgi:hypothetical protein
MSLIYSDNHQAYFALSSKQEWNKNDGDFDYEELYWHVHSLFDKKEAADKIIAHWDK